MYGNKIEVMGNDCVMRGRTRHKSYLAPHRAPYFSLTLLLGQTYFHSHHFPSTTTFTLLASHYSLS